MVRLDPTEVEMVKAGDLIAVVKSVRAREHLSLQEAKKVLDAYLAQNRAMYLPIEKVVVLSNTGMVDFVYVHTKLPTPVNAALSSTPLVLKFDAAEGTGRDYVREFFGIEPEMINPSRDTLR